jgi:thermitase
MGIQNNQSDLSNTQSTDIRQKFKYKKFIFIALGVILVVFLAILSFTPENNLEEKISPTPPPATPTIRAPRVEDQVILKFKEGVAEAQISERLKQYNATIVKRIYGSDLILVNVPKGQGDAMLDAFEKDNLVEQAQPNYIYKATTNDSSYNLQWGLKNTGQNIENKAGKTGDDINVEAAWAVTKGDGVKIAILDTGIDVNHQDLSSKIEAQKDFTDQGVNDGDGHGTHTAGIAAAATDNATGIAGTCPQCKLVIVKVLDNNGLGNTSSVISGINWAADPNNGVKVINMSFSGALVSAPAEQQAVSDAWAKGVVMVAAASNDGDTVKKYPGAYPNVVSVAATDNNDQMAYFSTHGTWVTVAAPGVDVYSTLPGNNYAYDSGTSMASPIVAGVAGLIWASSYGTSNDAVVKRLCDTADKIPGTGTNWICGRINAGKAVEASASISTSVTPAPSLSTVAPTFNCLGNPCPTLSPTQILTAPVTSIQPTSTQPGNPLKYVQPGNPLPSVNEPINKLPNNPNSSLVLILCCYMILFILKLLGIDLSSLGMDLGSQCNNI